MVLETRATGRSEARIDTMRAAVFHAPNDIRVEDVPRPSAGPGEAVIRVTLTTICGTDVHILKGEYPVRARPHHRPRAGRRHRRAGARGHRLRGRRAGARRRDHALRPVPRLPVRQAEPVRPRDGYEAIGGWRFGNTINGAQAEYLLVPNAQANLAKIPDALTDEQVVLLADIASTGFGGAESGKVRIGDAVVVFAQGPIGLCATAGAKLMGAALVIGVDGDPSRLAMATQDGRRRGARLRPRSTSSRRSSGSPADGADVAIEALGTQGTFETALRCAARRRHAVEPRRLLRQAPDPLRSLRSRPRRPHDRHDALPGRQGAHAAASCAWSRRGGSIRLH